MPTRIQKIGKVNGIKPSGKVLNLSDLIQESYKVSYEAKKSKNKKLVSLTESHIKNVTNNPTKVGILSEDLEILQKLVTMKKPIKFTESVKTSKTTKSVAKKTPAKKEKVSESISWKNSKDRLSKDLKGFRESSKSKVFFKELDKFNKTLSKGKPITINEAVNLYKATNSCLTHLTVELGKNPDFRKAYKECTLLLSRDNLKLLEAIQKNVIPDKALLESFVVFTNILLENNAPEDLDPEVYEECNESDDMLALDDKNVIDPENVDAEESIEEEVTVDLTDDEIRVLKSILGKISPMQEEADTVPDEEVVPEVDDTETDPIDDEVEDEEIIDDEIEEEVDDIEDEEIIEPEDDFEDETVEDEFDDYVEEEEIEDEELEEDDEEEEEVSYDPLARLNGLKEELDNIIGELESSVKLDEEDEEEDFVDDEEVLDEECEEPTEDEELEEGCEESEDEELDESEEGEIEDEELEESEEETVEDEEEELEENEENFDTLTDDDVKLSESSKMRIKRCFR